MVGGKNGDKIAEGGCRAAGRIVQAGVKVGDFAAENPGKVIMAAGMAC